MGQNDSDESNLEQMIQKLEASGYIIKKTPKQYVKKTFDIDHSLLSSVDTKRKELNKTLRDVFSEALLLWLAKQDP
jgi:hypothetical protein